MCFNFSVVEGSNEADSNSKRVDVALGRCIMCDSDI